MGYIRLRFQVWDANGCTNSLTKANYINLDHPEAAFTASERTICPGADVTFFDNSQSDTAIVAWAWDFGDGLGTSNAQNPTYSYQNSGFYDVTLTVTDIFGCMSVITQTAYIEVLVNEIPTFIDIRYVTVVGDDEVEIAYEAYDNQRNDLEDILFSEKLKVEIGFKYMPLQISMNYLGPIAD